MLNLTRDTTEKCWIIFWIIWTFPKISRIFRKIWSFFFKKLKILDIRSMFVKFRQNFIKISKKNTNFHAFFVKIWMNKLFKLFKNDKIVTTFFCWNFEIWAVQKYVSVYLSFSTSVLFSKRRINVNIVDLENPEKMSIWLLS